MRKQKRDEVKERKVYNSDERESVDHLLLHSKDKLSGFGSVMYLSLGGFR